MMHTVVEARVCSVSTGALARLLDAFGESSDECGLFNVSNYLAKYFLVLEDEIYD